MSYATGEPYETIRKANTFTAKHIGGADVVLPYTAKDVDEEYKEAHKDIFAYKCGAGLWLWKPYLVHKTLITLKDGDWLCYSDANSTFIRPLRHLIECAEKNDQDIFITEQPLLSRQFTKRECYTTLGLEDHDENQASAIIMLFRKSAKSVEFVEQWLRLCEREELLSPNKFHPEVEEWPDFEAHREDQSLLTLLRNKWQLPSFREPTDYGEMPFMYASGERAYNPKSYSNSPYPTILLCNRQKNPIMYFTKYVFKHILFKLGIHYTEERELAKRGAKRYVSNK